MESISEVLIPETRIGGLYQHYKEHTARCDVIQSHQIMLYWSELISDHTDVA